MFTEVFRFELKYQFRRSLLYIFAVSFFLMAFLIVSSDAVMPIGRGGNVARNAPFVIFNILTFMSLFGLVSLAFCVAPAVNRDRERNIHELYFATPVKTSAYVLGRFLGAAFPIVAAMIMSCAGILLARIMPWQDPADFVAFNIWPYVYSLVLFVFPNLFVSGAVFFSCATLTRKTFSAYIAVLGLLILYGVAKAFLGDLDNQTAVSLADPFGWSPFKIMTQYWTVAEKNSKLLPIGGLLLLNRILWISLGMGILALTVRRFRRMTGEASMKRGRKEYPGIEMCEVGGPALYSERSISGPIAALNFTAYARFKQLISHTIFEAKGVLRSTPFIVLMMFGAANLLARLFAIRGGVSAYPLTQEMLRKIESGFWIYPMLVIIIYGAELIWKDRRTRIHEITDALPIPNWIPLVSRLAALYVISVLMLVFAMTCTIGFQMAKGQFDLELLLYFKALFLIALSEWMLFAALAIFCQVIGGSLAVGTLLYVIYLMVQELPADLGFEHHMYTYPTAPEAPYSDMNGYGHFAAPLFWFRLYWGFFAGMLLVLAYWLWVRGTDNRLMLRIRKCRQRMTRRSLTAFAGFMIGFVMVGAWIFYNTNVLNTYMTKKGIEKLQVRYEKRYKQYEHLPQPKVTAAKLDVDIYPESRRVDIKGTLTLVNKTNTVIDELHITLDPTLVVNEYELPAQMAEIDDRETGYRICRLEEALVPGAALEFTFDISSINRGFVNDHSNVEVVGNGTFINNMDYVPRIGYYKGVELDEPKLRKKHGLAEQSFFAAVDDERALQYTFTHDADRIDFEAVVSTSRDQIAIAPGYLQREWEEEGRRYFHYKMDAPILNHYAFVSGRYEVARSQWRDVPIEVYYHKPHHMNVERMIESVRKSLEYFTENFSDYQHRQMRIIEFPGYRSFAQSFPNTVPFSEAIHFVDDLRDEDKLDKVFYVTAHEVAHQWWAYQVTGGVVQGCELLSESMAQYSALMAMEKDYGADKMKRFLRYELDGYLRGRGEEAKAEPPLMLVEDEPYVFYKKGSLVMYALRDYIGEDALNDALCRYIEATAYQGPPYTNSIEFLSYIQNAVPERYQYLIEDLFETITLFDNRVDDVNVVKMDDGRYRLTLAYQSHKMRADGKGMETEVDHNDWIEIGVYGEREIEGKIIETTLYRDKHQLANGTGEVEIIVDDKPVRAGIDPRNILIDRFPDDNIKNISG
jgi:ABC-type transport system involved in multi-copper enzyme maturation permease subunit